MLKTLLKIGGGLLVIAAVIAFFVLDGPSHLSFEALKKSQSSFQSWYADHAALAIAGFAGLYVVVTALSLPGAAVLSLAAGAIFGIWLGSLIVILSSTTGATGAFLVTRYILRDAIRSRFRQRIRTINRGVARDGAFYLFTLRLIPVIPFFVINTVMGLTSMRVLTFAVVSFVGMLPGTFVYVNAGTQLAHIESPGEILSFTVIGSFLALALVPWVAKICIGWWKFHRTSGRFSRPKLFSYDVVVIGAGSGGLTAANVAATLRGKVALVEKAHMGGDCLNTGCVPSKALIRAAQLRTDVGLAQEWGLGLSTGTVDFAAVMERVQQVIATVAPHDSRERYRAMGVACVSGTARIRDPYRIEVNGEVLTTRSIIIATGSRPQVPSIPGIESLGALTSDTIWSLRTLPPRLVIVGGGPVGCELAQCFARFGSHVTIIHGADHLLDKEDADMAALVTARFRDEGITVETNRRVIRGERAGDDRVVISEKDGQEQRHVCDAVLFAVGRQPNTSGLGLQEIGVELHKDKDSIVVDDLQRTNFPNIYACGDVSSAFRFTHIAGAQGWRAAANAVLAPFSKQRFDDAIVPWITFTDPAVGRVGLSEAEAKETETPFEITRIDLADNDRAIADGTAYGTVKVLTEPGRDTILGATVVGAQAAEILPEFVLAMRHGLGLGKLLDTIHVYPTASEAVVQVASAWKRAHASPRQLAWAERYLKLRRSPGKTAWLVGAVLAVPLLGLGIWAALAWLGRGGGD